MPFERLATTLRLEAWFPAPEGFTPEPPHFRIRILRRETPGAEYTVHDCIPICQISTLEGAKKELRKMREPAYIVKMIPPPCYTHSWMPVDARDAIAREQGFKDHEWKVEIVHTPH